MGNRAIVRHREPQSYEKAGLSGLLVVVERAATVIGHVGVQELDVTGLQNHLESQFLCDLEEHVDRFGLSCCQFRHAGGGLGGLDVGQREVTGEAAVTQPEDG